MVKLLQCFARESKNLKHLELHQSCSATQMQEFGLDDALGDFKQIESLHLWIDSFYDFEDFCFDYLYGQLPKLRYLSINRGDLDKDDIYSFILPMFSDNRLLEKITFESCTDGFLDDLKEQRFFDEFIETITSAAKSNARIEVEMHGQRIGSITKNGIVWQH